MSNSTIILAGGMSKRLGRHKPFLTIHGEPLIERMINQALKFSDIIILSIGNSDSTKIYERFQSNRVIIAKDSSEIQSPLVGILTGLREIKSKYVMVLPCDLPFVNDGVANFLFEKALGFDAAIPKWSNGNIEPLHSVYKVLEARQAAEESLSNGQLKVSKMIEKLKNVVYVNVEEISIIDKKLLTFFNVNTNEELTKADGILKNQFIINDASI